jgi:hypothetical protein
MMTAWRKPIDAEERAFHAVRGSTPRTITAATMPLGSVIGSTTQQYPEPEHANEDESTNGLGAPDGSVRHSGNRRDVEELEQPEEGCEHARPEADGNRDPPRARRDVWTEPPAQHRGHGGAREPDAERTEQPGEADRIERDPRARERDEDADGHSGEAQPHRSTPYVLLRDITL